MANEKGQLGVELAKLIERIETIVPYVTATIDPQGGNTFHATRGADWVEVHRGRAASSTAQLNRLLADAMALKAKL